MDFSSLEGMDSYGYGDVSTSPFGLLGLAGFLMKFLVIILVFIVIAYVVGSLAYQRCFKMFGYSKPWMAWIPFARDYALTNLTLNGYEAISVFGKEIPYSVFKWWWLSTILGAVLSMVPLVPLIFMVIRVIGMSECLSEVFAATGTDEKSIKMLSIVSALIPIITIVKFLTMQPVEQEE